MNKVKLKNKYRLLIPKRINRYEIANFIDKKLDKEIGFVTGIEDSYTVLIKNRDTSNTNGRCIEVTIQEENNIPITTITESIFGVEEYGERSFETNLDIMNAFCKEYQGIILIDYYRTTSFLELDKTGYIINYDENSIEYKLINLLINDTKNMYETLTFAEIFKKKKTKLLEIIK